MIEWVWEREGVTSIKDDSGLFFTNDGAMHWGKDAEQLWWERELVEMVTQFWKC